MLNFILKRRGAVVNIFKPNVTKRQINGNVLSRKSSIVFISNNVEKQFRPNYASLVGVIDRKYSILPEPIEAQKTRKIFVGHEDIFAHSILESKEIYSATLAKKPAIFHDEITENEIDNYIRKSWKNLPIPEIVKAFQRISYYASKHDEDILDEKYQKFFKYLIANCSQFTDSEIGDILISLSLWPVTYTRRDPNFKPLFEALDTECLRRAPLWRVEELLLMSDHWFRLRMYRYTEFGSFTIRKLGGRPNRMSPANLVQFMFLVNTARTHPKEMYNLEFKMESCVDELDLNELAILSMGFFKSQTPIRNSNLLVKLIHRVIKEIDTVNEISLSAFMKIIRYSYTIQNECAILWELLVSTIPEIPRLSLQALIHIVAMSVKMRIFHPELLTPIAERFNKEIKDARIKDMERLVLALTCFNFTPDIKPNIFQTIVDELRKPERRPDLERYQRSLANLLQYLSVVNLYPKDLLAYVLDPENLRNVYVKVPYYLSHSVFVIDLNIDAEVPDYTGPRLSNKARLSLAKGYVNAIPEFNDRELSVRHNFLLQIMDTCKEIFGSTEMMHSDWVLPHFKELDVIICLDKNNSPLPVKPALSEIPIGNVKRKPEIYPEDTRWLAIVIGAQNCYIRNTTQLLGKDCVKIRQLERIGYKPILIPFYEWSTIDRDRRKYLKEKLFK